MKNKLLLFVTALTIQVNAQIIPAYLPANGLVAWYPFNNNPNDESGHGYDPTYIGSGVTLTTDRLSNVNRAYHFDGATGSYIRIPADNFPTNDRTVSIWFNVSTVTNRPLLLGYGGGGCTGTGTSFLMGLNMSGTASYTSQAHYGSNEIDYAYGTEPLNQWTNWVITISGSTIQLYIDGVLTPASGTFTNPTVVAGTDLVFGVMPWCDGVAPYTDANGGYLQGDLDDIAIWDRALNATEIMNVYEGNLSVQGISPEHSFQIYPNLAQDQITLKQNGISVGNNYVIKDAIGRVVLTGAMSSTEMQIDVSALAKGIYFITDENGLFCEKFVKE